VAAILIPGMTGVGVGIRATARAAEVTDGVLDANKLARAGHNGVEGPVHVARRTTRSGEPAATITYPDGSVKDVSRKRVKEYVPQTHPKAPPGSKQKVKFDNPLPGSKGYKREPTDEDISQAGVGK
jgi:hypothetical protein